MRRVHVGMQRGAVLSALAVFVAGAAMGAQGAGGMREFRPAKDPTERVVVVKEDDGYRLSAVAALQEDILQEIAVKSGAALEVYCEDPTAITARRDVNARQATVAELVTAARGEEHTFVYRDSEGRTIDDPAGADREKVAVVAAYPPGCERSGAPVRRFVRGTGHPILGRDMSQNSVEELAAVVAKEGPGSRRIALEQLGRRPDPAGLPLAIQAVDDPNPRVMMAAVRTLMVYARRKGATDEAAAIARRFEKDGYLDLVVDLAMLSKDRAWPAIEELSRSPDDRAQETAVRALSISLDPRGVPALARLARQGERGRAEQAALVLGRIGGQEAVDALADLMSSEDEERRAIALEGVAMLPPADQAGLHNKVAQMLKGRSTTEATYAAFARRSQMEPLNEVLADPAVEGSAKITLLNTLATEGNEDAIPSMGTALEDKRPEVRRAAVSAMTRMATEKSIPLLVKASKDPSPEVRADAAYGMGDLFLDDEIVAALRTLVKDPNAEVRKNAINALGHLGKPNDDTVAIFREAKGSADPYVAKRAAELLRYWQVEK